MKFIKSKKTILAIGLLLLVFMLVFPAVTHATEEWGSYLNNGGIESEDTISVGYIADWIITGVLELFNAFAGFLLNFSISAVNLTTSSALFDDVFFSPFAIDGINEGWALVRDFVNMFFILILVFLAIATILRINKFSDKRLLFFVIFAALLVNFSKPITVFLIDISNLAMSFFIQNLRIANEGYGEILMTNMKMQEVYKVEIKGSDLARYVALVTGAAFKFILAIMLFVLAISLVIRMIALWVLIILSPLAFFGIALPGTFLSALKDGWIRKLVYWCFFGPILLFFLWLALVVVSAVAQSVDASDNPFLTFQNMDYGNAGITFIVNALRITIPFIAAVYMLFYGYNLTKSMSAGVGGSVLGLMNKGQGFMSRWGKRGAAVAGTMATGGLGLGAYLGYKAGSNYAKDRYGSAKAGLTQRYTDKRDKAKKKTTARFAGKMDEYEATEANEQLKKWEEQGAPDEAKLKELSKSGKGPERAAALLRLAKDGKVNKDDYANAMGALANNPKLMQRFSDSVNKKNLGAKLEYEIDKQVNSERMSQGGQIDQGRINEIRTSKYSEAMDKMKLKDIGEQDVQFHMSPEFEAIMKERVRSGRETVKKIKDQDVPAEVKRVWEGKGWFAPDNTEEGGSGI